MSPAGLAVALGMALGVMAAVVGRPAGLWLAAAGAVAVTAGLAALIARPAVRPLPAAAVRPLPAAAERPTGDLVFDAVVGPDFYGGS